MPKANQFTQIAIVLLAIGVGSPCPLALMANEDHALNRVWSRMADISGEFGSVESAEFSPDSGRIVTGTKYDNTVRVWRTEDGAMLWKTELPAEIERVAWTADGKTVVSVSEDQYLRVIDASNGEVVREIKHGNGMDSLALSPDGRIMAVGEELRGGQTGAAVEVPVILYDTQTWQEIRRVDQTDTANEIDFTPDGKRFVVVGAGHFRLWDTETGKQLHHQKVFADGENRNLARFICTKISPDGKYIAVGSNRGDIYFFDAQTGRYIRRLNKTGDKLETVEWTKDGQYVLSAGKANVIDFIATKHAVDTRLNNGSVPIAMRIKMTDQLEYMHFNKTGALLTTAHQDGTVQLWTYMSDNPGVNQFKHRALSAKQEAAYGK
ncbi:MAG: PQQ-binding-like beta-propeller repeat protein [Planctomycetota bacterium]